MGHGSFSGAPRAEWQTEPEVPDRRMKLLAEFQYVDPQGRPWLAPQDSLVDGASIPRALWSLVGSPYTGDYRRASIVHDLACDAAGDDKALRLLADRMFFHACRAGGCSPAQAIILYVGVRIGAAARHVPAWRAALAAEAMGPRIYRSSEELQLERDFQDIASQVLEPGETEDLDELERRLQSASIATIGMRILP